MSDFDFINPPPKVVRTYQLMDGPAMKEIAYLQCMERNFVSYLAERYKNGEAVEIANLCDQTLDHSGRLLGRVRNVASGIKGWEPVALVGGPSK